MLEEKNNKHKEISKIKKGSILSTEDHIWKKIETGKKLLQTWQAKNLTQ